MLILNPTKPIYIDKKKKTIRMGNFKNIDKEIIYEDESVLKIFEDLRAPMEKEKLIQKLKHETNTDIKEINSAINYLIAENFIVEELEYLNILNDNELKAIAQL